MADDGHPFRPLHHELAEDLFDIAKGMLEQEQAVVDAPPPRRFGAADPTSAAALFAQTYARPSIWTMLGSETLLRYMAIGSGVDEVWIERVADAAEARIVVRCRVCKGLGVHFVTERALHSEPSPIGVVIDGIRRAKAAHECSSAFVGSG